MPRHPLTPKTLGTAAPAGRVLILGLGNDLLSDDSIGLRLAQALRPQFEANGMAVLESGEMGLGLLDLVAGYDRLIVIDAIQTRHGQPGTVHNLSMEYLKLLPAVSPHFLGLSEALALGRLLGLHVPEQVTIFAVEVEDPLTLSEHLTPGLEAAFPHLLAQVTAAIEQAGPQARHFGT